MQPPSLRRPTPILAPLGSSCGVSRRGGLWEAEVEKISVGNLAKAPLLHPYVFSYVENEGSYLESYIRNR